MPKITSSTTVSPNYVHMPWPSIPDEMRGRLVEYTKNTPIIGDGVAGGRLIEGIPVYGIVRPPKYLTKWVEENIPLKDHFLGIQRFYGMEDVRIHIDSIREYCFNCLLTDTGPVTSFYDNNKKIVESVTYQQNEWYRHETKRYHGVTGIPEPYRISITMFKVDLQQTGALRSEGKAFVQAVSVFPPKK